MYDDLSEIFRGLGNPARIAILMMVDTHSLGEIAKAQKISRPALQRHLDQLRKLGLISKGRGRKFSVTELGIEAKRLVQGFEGLAAKIGEVEREKTEVLSLKSLEQTIKAGLLKPIEARRLLSKAISTGALKSPDAKSRARLMLRKLDQTGKHS